MFAKQAATPSHPYSQPPHPQLIPSLPLYSQLAKSASAPTSLENFFPLLAKAPWEKPKPHAAKPLNLDDTALAPALPYPLKTNGADVA
jgi:hypothetical protein